MEQSVTSHQHRCIVCTYEWRDLAPCGSTVVHPLEGFRRRSSVFFLPYIVVYDYTGIGFWNIINTSKEQKIAIMKPHDWKMCGLERVTDVQVDAALNQWVCVLTKDSSGFFNVNVLRKHQKRFVLQQRWSIGDLHPPNLQTFSIVPAHKHVQLPAHIVAVGFNRRGDPFVSPKKPVLESTCAVGFVYPSNTVHVQTCRKKMHRALPSIRLGEHSTVRKLANGLLVESTVVVDVHDDKIRLRQVPSHQNPHAATVTTQNNAVITIDGDMAHVQFFDCVRTIP